MKKKKCKEKDLDGVQNDTKNKINKSKVYRSFPQKQTLILTESLWLDQTNLCHVRWTNHIIKGWSLSIFWNRMTLMDREVGYKP